MKGRTVFGVSFKLAYEAYEEAASYLPHPEWLRELLNSGLAKTEDLDTLGRILEKEEQEQEDSTKETFLEHFTSERETL